MRIFLLLSALFLYTNSCPIGFIDGNDSFCYQFDERVLSKDKASAWCKGIGGTLAMPKNAFANSFITTTRSEDATNYMWIGISCTGTVITSCKYDDGTQLTTKSYNNFMPGKISNATGVLMWARGFDTGRWLSADGSYETDFACQVPKKH